jgi:hypothetical protein
VASIGGDGTGGRCSGDEVAAADNAPNLEGDDANVRLILDIEARNDDNMVRLASAQRESQSLTSPSALKKWNALAVLFGTRREKIKKDPQNVCLLSLSRLVLDRIRES